KGYTVAGTLSSHTQADWPNLVAIQDQLDLVPTELTDRGQIDALVKRLEPDEIYHLAAPSVVPASWLDPVAPPGFLSRSVVRLLDAIMRISPHTRFFHAASSEIFRGAESAPQNEDSPPRPTSPYGVGKIAGHALVNSYRAQHDLFACSGILYNHESPRRP